MRYSLRCALLHFAAALVLVLPFRASATACQANGLQYDCSPALEGPARYAGVVPGTSLWTDISSSAAAAQAEIEAKLLRYWSVTPFQCPTVANGGWSGFAPVPGMPGLNVSKKNFAVSCPTWSTPANVVAEVTESKSVYCTPPAVLNTSSFPTPQCLLPYVPPPPFPPEGCAAGANGFFACPKSTPIATPPAADTPLQNIGNPQAPLPTADPRAVADTGDGSVPGDFTTEQTRCLADPPDVAGNPIHVATGNKYQREMDYADATLSFVRHYNSALRAWTHTFTMRVWGYPDRAVVVRPDGRTLVFNGAGTGEWRSSAATSERLFYLGSGAQAWKFVGNDDTVEIYGPDGYPLETVARGGRRLRMQYSGGNMVAVADDFGRALQFDYDTRGRLAVLTQPDGGKVQYGYSERGNFSTVTFPDATRRGYVYEDVRFPWALTGLIDEAGTRLATWAYESAGRAVSSRHALQTSSYSVAYDATGLLARVTDPLGAERLLQQQSIGGRLLFAGSSAPCDGCSGDAASKTFDTRGNVTRRVDHAGVVAQYQYNGRKLPAAVVKAVGRPEEQAQLVDWHPTLSVPLRITEFGRATEFTYDELGNVLTRTVRPTFSATPAARTWRWTYTAQGLVETATDPKLSVWRFAYDSLGNRTAVINPLGETTTYTHDLAGRVLTEIWPNGLKTELAYDARGRVLRMARGGEVTTFTYSPAGLLLGSTLPGGYTVAYTYDAAQRLTGASDNRGAHVAFTLDALGNRVREEVRDAGGSLARVTSRVVNALNQVEALQGAAGQETRFEYDANGELAAFTDPLGQRTRRTLDALRRETGATYADGNATAQEWGRLDELVRFADAKRVATTFAYNGLGEVVSETSPDTGNLRYTRDAAGDVATVEDAKGQVTTTERDALGRPANVRFHDGSSARYEYDTAGSLTSIVDPSGSTTYVRDLQGRVLSAVQAVNDNPASPTVHRVAYEYTQGELTSVSYPSGLKVTYVRQAGRVTGVNVATARNEASAFATGIDYTALGQAKAWRWASGDTAARTFDADGRMAGNEFAGYTYDAAGRITAVTQHLWAQPTRGSPTRKAVTWAASYDTRNRLTGFVRDGAGSTFTYDANSNRVTGTDTASSGLDLEAEFDTAAASRTAAQSNNVEATSNRLLGVTVRTTTVRGTSTSVLTAQVDHAPDANGAMTSDGLRRFEYDAASRLSKVGLTKDGEAASVVYLTNALGLRVFKSEPQVEQLAPGEDRLGRDFISWLRANFGWLFAKGNSRTLLGTAFVYDEGGNLLGEYDNGTSLAKGASEYIWLPVEGGASVPIGLYRGGRFYAIHTDHLGTPRLVTDGANTAVWQWPYSAFGNNKPTGMLFLADTGALRGTVPGVEVGLRYPGQYFDAETGLVYNRFRTYCAHCGRYTQADPVGLLGGVNRFIYADADPLRKIDPMGLMGGFGSGAGQRRGPPIPNAFGCIGLACVTGGSEPTTMSTELTFGGGVEICDAPLTEPPEQMCKDRRGIVRQMDPPGVPVPKRFGGAFFSPGIKRDGRICIRMGVFVSPRMPLPSLDMGSVEPLR